MNHSSSPAAAPGCIVLAAYRPEPELFARQLRSIQAQSVADFRCLIVADGGRREVEALLSSILPGDSRFDVIGADSRVGFYRNFERGLASVPPDSPWVALSDQDDHWYPDKLARLLPHLASASLVGAQARVVEYPSGRVIASSTDRRHCTPDVLTVSNQFTGGMTVMRTELLVRALPFPDYPSPAQVHDHWLALVASCERGAVVVPDIVQDYVQHGGNVLGESDDEGGMTRAWRNLRTRAADEDGTSGVRALATAAYVVSAGWAEAMADALIERFGAHEPVARRLSELYGRHRSVGRTALVLTRRVMQRRLPVRNAVVYIVGAASRRIARG